MVKLSDKAAQLQAYIYVKNNITLAAVPLFTNG
jgi:hypothetical protein